MLLHQFVGWTCLNPGTLTGALNKHVPGLARSCSKMSYPLACQGGHIISIGDTCELAASVGEEHPRVSRVRALWAEPCAGGQTRMLARMQLFAHSQVLYCLRSCDDHATRSAASWWSSLDGIMCRIPASLPLEV